MKINYGEWTIVVFRQVDEEWRRLRNPPYGDYCAVATRYVGDRKIYGFNVEANSAALALSSAKNICDSK